MPRHDVASLNDLAESRMHPVEIEGTPILLFREGEAVHAVGATCPHAGGPLAEGVLNAGRVICPWHKAVFCLRSGALLDPPAVDALPRYRVDCEAGRVLVTLPAEQPEPPAAVPDQRLFAIVGAGAAGALAAQTLRQEGFGGRIVMLDRVNRVPYDRTRLSKYHLSGTHGDEKTPLQSQGFYRQHAIERRTAEVETLDAATRTIHCADGAVLSYDMALLATGGAPALPPLPGAHLDNVFLLRSRADADAILAQAERSERVVVLGASFIGMEVAASLRERGLEVTVVGRETAPFAKQFGAEIGNAMVGLHRENGVAFRLGQTVEAILGETAAEVVALAGGERLAADLVVIGYGVKPVTGYLRGVELNADGSVSVDATLKAADGLYAAGDIARYKYRGSPIRVEHWRVAEQHGRTAALNMMGRGVDYDAVPVFWTIQYMKQLTYIGHAADWDDIVVHGDLDKREFLAYYVKNGRVVAAAGMDRDRETSALIALLQRRDDWTVEALGTELSRFD